MPLQFRVEHDAFGAVEIPADRYWGAQTQRALGVFRSVLSALSASKNSPRHALTAALAHWTRRWPTQSRLQPGSCMRVDSTSIFHW
jgi:hypothetical protein